MYFDKAAAILANESLESGRMYLETLTEIANRYGTDKGTSGPTDRRVPHNYTDVYEGYLSALRDKPIRLLEIGLGVHGENKKASIAQGRNAEGGASMKMWRDYFTAASIFGIDINDGRFLDGPRTRTAVVDQGDREQLQRFIEAIGSVDVIVDDGSHRADHQQISFGTLFPYLSAGGLYFIEDLRKNGINDAKNGAKLPSYYTSVRNTRTLFREYRASGRFPEPNALENADYLCDQIAEIAFHCPRFGVQKGQWTVGSESVCVIRKKIGAL